MTGSEGSGYSRGDVVLVSLPFTDGSGAKRRPAAIVSSEAYHTSRADAIILLITGNLDPPRRCGDYLLRHWQKAGLLYPSIAKPILATLDRRIIIRKLGTLDPQDLRGVETGLRAALGIE